MLDLTLTKLQLAIHRSGIPEAEILRAAGMCPRHLYKVQRGDFELSAKAGTRIRLAMERVKKLRRGVIEDEERIPVEHGVLVQYRLALALIEALGGEKVADVLAQNPDKRATADPAWLRAANARRIALYIVNQFGNVPQAELGRAVNMTKSAVHQGIKQIAQIRDQAEVRQFLDLVEGAFQG